MLYVGLVFWAGYKDDCFLLLNGTDSDKTNVSWKNLCHLIKQVRAWTGGRQACVPGTLRHTCRGSETIGYKCHADFVIYEVFYTSEEVYNFHCFCQSAKAFIAFFCGNELLKLEICCSAGNRPCTAIT